MRRPATVPMASTASGEERVAVEGPRPVQKASETAKPPVENKAPASTTSTSTTDWQAARMWDWRAASKRAMELKFDPPPVGREVEEALPATKQLKKTPPRGSGLTLTEAGTGNAFAPGAEKAGAADGDDGEDKSTDPPVAGPGKKRKRHSES